MLRSGCLAARSRHVCALARAATCLPVRPLFPWPSRESEEEWRVYNWALAFEGHGTRSASSKPATRSSSEAQMHTLHTILLPQRPLAHLEQDLPHLALTRQCRTRQTGRVKQVTKAMRKCRCLHCRSSGRWGRRHRPITFICTDGVCSSLFTRFVTDISRIIGRLCSIGVAIGRGRGRSRIGTVRFSFAFASAFCTVCLFCRCCRCACGGVGFGEWVRNVGFGYR